MIRDGMSQDGKDMLAFSIVLFVIILAFGAGYGACVHYTKMTHEFDMEENRCVEATK